MIFSDILYILIGIITDSLNNIGIKFTTSKFLKTKNQSIILLSLTLRLILFALVFYFTTKGSFKKAVLFVVGITISKILFIIKNGRRNANINR